MVALVAAVVLAASCSSSTGSTGAPGSSPVGRTTVVVPGGGTGGSPGLPTAPGTDPSPPTADRTAPPTASVGPAEVVRRLLGRLRVALVDRALPPYRRKAFGDGWDYDRASGCNTRERVLIAESLTPAVLGPRCKVLSGRWTSRYDGVTTTDPADLQIDHLVPLGDAWGSGASDWTAIRREQFANDLTDPATLIAVTGRTNESKGDKAPDHWLPPDPAARCPYVADWIEVKARWGLSVTPTEHDALARVLAGC